MTERKFVEGRTVGQKLLIETRASLAELARCARVSRPTVSKWRDGNTVPNERARTALSRAYSIPFDAWEKMLPRGVEIEVIPGKPGRPRKKRTQTETKTETKTETDADAEDDEGDGMRAAFTVTETQTDADEMRAAFTVAPKYDSPYPEQPGPTATIVESMKYSLACIRYDLRVRDLTTAARSKLRGDEARTLGHIAKLQRDEELRETNYVKNHPAFRAHCLKILNALRPFPDAAKAVAKALND